MRFSRLQILHRKDLVLCLPLVILCGYHLSSQYKLVSWLNIHTKYLDGWLCLSSCSTVSKYTSCYESIFLWLLSLVRIPAIICMVSIKTLHLINFYEIFKKHLKTHLPFCPSQFILYQVMWHQIYLNSCSIFLFYYFCSYWFYYLSRCQLTKGSVSAKSKPSGCTT